MILVFVVLIESLNTVMVKSKKVIHAVVAVIVDTNTDKVLVSKRREGQSYAGFWEFPGGKIEESEEILESLRRELKEELNIDLISSEYLSTVDYSYPEFDVKLEVYKITSYSGIIIGNEGQEIAWQHVSELINLKPLLPGSVDLIELIF